MAAEPPMSHAERGEQAAKISREMVSIVRRVAGRGPTRARTTIAREHVIVMLEDGLTEGERTLVGAGHHSEVMAVRRAYQEVMETEASAAISAIIGREVIGFMSANHLEPDIAAEIFILDRQSASADGGPQEAEHSEDGDG